MNRRSLSLRARRAIALATCASLGTAPLQAQQANPVLALSDLVNQTYDYTQNQLRGRNYTYVHADQRGSKQWQYWWQQREHLCARVAYVEGRATSIVESAPTDCNQPPASEASKDRGMSDGAKVAIAAAAVLGVAALAHKSHERDDKYRSERDVAEFDRGYRDGLYHQPYHDYGRSQAYVDGYNAGQQKRDAETAYRSPWGHHSGQASYVNLYDLVGSRGSTAGNTLRQRGFVPKGGYEQGGTDHRTWWSANTRQCMQVVLRSERVQAINSLNEGNCL